jgi:hypothetical protein
VSDGIEAWLVDQHNRSVHPRHGRKVNCPPEFAFDLLAERFHQDPLSWPYQHDAVAVLRFLNRRVAEGEARNWLARHQGEPLLSYEG